MSTVVAAVGATASAGIATVAAGAPPGIAVIGSISLGAVFGFFYAADTAPAPS